jgi:hypothetical protein
MPVGALVGGIVVAIVSTFDSREHALRSVWFVNGGIHLVLFVMGRRLLTTEKIDAARAAATGASVS